MKNRVAVLVDRSAMGFPVRRRRADPRGARRPRRWTASPRARGARGPLPGRGATASTRSSAPVSAEALRGAGARRPHRPARRAAGAEGHRQRGKPQALRLLLSRRRGQRRAAAGLQPRQADELSDARRPGLHLPGRASGAEGPRGRDVKVDDFAFVRNAITVEVEVRGRGLTGRDVPVVLQREGQTVAHPHVQLDQDDERAAGVVHLHARPDRALRLHGGGAGVPRTRRWRRTTPAPSC